MWVGRRAVVAICGVASAAAMLAAPGAAAAQFTVTTTADSGDGSLRKAIADANGAGGFNSIGIDLPANSTIELSSALPAITETVEIRGPAGGVTVDGNQMAAPVLSNGGGITTTLIDLTVTGGMSPGGTLALASGIHNHGLLTLLRVTVRDNIATATGASVDSMVLGAGIFNDGTLYLSQSTVSGNQATATVTGIGAAASASGAGIYNQPTRTVSLLRSTVSGNTATANAVGTVTGSARGGGILNAGNAVLDRVTLSGNSVRGIGSAVVAGGGIHEAGLSLDITSSTIAGNSGEPADTVPANLSFAAPGSTGNRRLMNTIVARPVGGINCSALVTSLGHNIESPTNTCGITGPEDRNSTPPQLLMLDENLLDNGGPTRTLELLPGSVAIDSGEPAAAEMLDQRGQPRTVDLPGYANGYFVAGADVGPFERQPSDDPPTVEPPVSPVPAATVPPATPTVKKSCKRKKKKKARAAKRCKKRQRRK